MRIESPSTGPTSSTCTCNSPVGLGGCARHHGKPHLTNANVPAPTTNTSTAIAHPHPRVERFTFRPSVLRESRHAEDQIYSRRSALWESDRVVRERKRARVSQHRLYARSFRGPLLHQCRDKYGWLHSPQY